MNTKEARQEMVGSIVLILLGLVIATAWFEFYVKPTDQAATAIRDCEIEIYNSTDRWVDPRNVFEQCREAYVEGRLR